MELKKKYAKVVKEMEAKNYDAALKLLYKMRAHEKDFYYLEAVIYRGLKNVLKAYRALKKLLLFLLRSSPKDEEIYDSCLFNIGACCSQIEKCPAES